MLLMKNTDNLLARLFVISLLTFRYFPTIASLFGAGAAPFFTAPAPAPAPSKPFRRLRLRLRLRPKCVGSGGSGSGSGSGSASLLVSIREACTKRYRYVKSIFHRGEAFFATLALIWPLMVMRNIAVNLATRVPRLACSSADNVSGSLPLPGLSWP